MKLNYFNFKYFGENILMTNDFGRYLFVSQEEFHYILSKKLSPNSALWEKLKAEKMIYDCTDLEYTSLNRYELRERKNFLNTATALHIFVLTTRCNLNCVYCQASSGKQNKHFVMDFKTAESAVDVALQSPANHLDFEFQGGEPLLNYEVLKHIVVYSEQRKRCHEISYNLVTNATLLSDEMLDFFSQHSFSISVSIDGDSHMHDQNRKFFDGTGSFSAVYNAIKKIRNFGLPAGVIETTTKQMLNYPEETVDAYVELGFDSIFLRFLTPLGRAVSEWGEIGYTSEEFIEFYIKAINKLIKLNMEGTFIKENLASVFFRKIYGYPVNYMELRSPCGVGIGQLAYNADGRIFTCDEGRMLYEMGIDEFCLGNVNENSYDEIISNGICKTVCASSILESLPGCCDCVYQPYCGTCPVVNFALHNDVIEKEPHSYRCKIYSEILDYFFLKLFENDRKTIDVIMSWIG